MACSFPNSVDSIDEWLAALGMQRYSTAFVGIPVEQICELTDVRLQELGVKVVGHRRRLLIGASHLLASTTVMSTDEKSDEYYSSPPPPQHTRTPQASEPPSGLPTLLAA